MTWTEGVAVELLLLAIAWNGVKLLTRSIRGFLDLRLEIWRQMARFPHPASPPLNTPVGTHRAMPAGTPGAMPAGTPGTMPAGLPGNDPPPEHDPRLAPEVFRTLGFRMLAFAEQARLAVWVVRLMGYDPTRAGDNLISLAQDTRFVFRRKAVADALRFKEGELP